MRIGIVSDTHGDLKALQKVLDQAGPVDLWLHAGDYSQDAPYIEAETNLPVMAVCAIAICTKAGRQQNWLLARKALPLL